MRNSIPTSWIGARSTLDGGRDKSHRTIGNNTALVARTGGAIALRLHGTDVATYEPDGTITLSMGGWDTVTTRDRINGALPGPWSIGSHRVSGESYPWLWHHGYPVLPFLDGMAVDPEEGAILVSGEVIMTADDIAAESARLEAVRVVRDAQQADRLAAQHERGAAGAFGTASAYDWRTQTSGTVTAYHPRSYSGTSWRCPSCAALRDVTA